MVRHALIPAAVSAIDLNLVVVVVLFSSTEYLPTEYICEKWDDCLEASC